jgi:hypothetical protein
MKKEKALFIAGVVAVIITFLLIDTGAYLLYTGHLNGPQGIQGLKGEQGIQGVQGKQGVQGLQGIQGKTGATGATGSHGATGATGSTGPKGDKGDIGPPGINGTSGNGTGIGPKGDNGDKGDKGDTGIRGPPGNNGLPGEDAPVNSPPVIELIGLSGYHKKCDGYLFNITVHVSDADDISVHTTISYAEACDPHLGYSTWVKVSEFVGNNVDGFGCVSLKCSKTVYWLVESWDGSDITNQAYQYTIN